MERALVGDDRRSADTEVLYRCMMRHRCRVGSFPSDCGGPLIKKSSCRTATWSDNPKKIEHVSPESSTSATFCPIFRRKSTSLTGPAACDASCDRTLSAQYLRAWYLIIGARGECINLDCNTRIRHYFVRESSTRYVVAVDPSPSLRRMI